MVVGGREGEREDSGDALYIIQPRVLLLLLRVRDQG